MSALSPTAPSVGLDANGRSSDGRLTRTAAEFAQRVDVLALSIGSRVSASVLLLACVVVILVGAQSLLGSLEAMDADIAAMNEQLETANEGLVVLNTTMESVEPMAKSMHAIVGSVDATGAEVATSAQTIGAMAETTDTLEGRLGRIATSTTKMRTSYEAMSGETVELATTIEGLNKQIGPLAKTQHEMYLETIKMRGGLDTMNDSLAYVVRILNYITAPPSGQDFTIRAELPKETMPPIPGLKAEVEPVGVFARMSWPIFRK